MQKRPTGYPAGRSADQNRHLCCSISVIPVPYPLRGALDLNYRQVFRLGFWTAVSGLLAYLQWAHLPG